MRCPKCGSEQIGEPVLCDLCGIVFEKYARRQLGREAVLAGERALPAAPARFDPAGLLLGRPTDGLALAGRALLCAFLCVWGFRLMRSPIETNAVGESFLHLINLPFHEAGHVFFSPFGDFMHSLGGTLGQLLMPLLCLGALLFKTRDAFGASVALWWFGENFLDIAPYIDDARDGQLPLLGGNYGETSPYGFHDWEYLLTESGLLNHDHELARRSQALGTAIMLAALAWGALVLVRSWRLARERVPR